MGACHKGRAQLTQKEPDVEVDKPTTAKAQSRRQMSLQEEARLEWNCLKVQGPVGGQKLQAAIRSQLQLNLCICCETNVLQDTLCIGRHSQFRD